MQITPIQTTNFNGYRPTDIKKLSAYTIEKKQGSLFDLYRKFDSSLIDMFEKSGKISVPKFTQNWKLGQNLNHTVTTKTNQPKGAFFVQKDTKPSEYKN